VVFVQSKSKAKNACATKEGINTEITEFTEKRSEVWGQGLRGRRAGF
jgi:hypothetical protein